MNGIEDKLQENALGPKRASGDSGSVEQHSIQDQIAADRYLNAKKATNKRNRGLRMNRISSPGAGEQG